METKNGKVHGTIIIPSSMDNVETAIIASSLETIDRIGPCNAIIKVLQISDIVQRSARLWWTAPRNCCSPW